MWTHQYWNLSKLNKNIKFSKWNLKNMKITFFIIYSKANFGVKIHKIWKYAYLLMFDFHDFRIFKGLNKWQISKCPLGEEIKIVLFIKEYVVEAIKCMVKNSHFMVNTVYNNFH